MKLVDEKGRIFGRMNLIDLIVIVAVVVLAVVLGMRYLGSDAGGPLGGSNKLVYTVRVYNVEEDVYNSILAQPLPDQLMAAGDMLDGHVVGMTAEVSEGAAYTVEPGDDGTLDIESLGGETYDLTFTIEATVAANPKNEVGTQEVRVGKKHIVKTQNFELEEGMILTLQKSEA